MLNPNTPVQIVPVVLPQTGDPSNSGRVRNLPVSPQAIPPWLEYRPAINGRPGYFAVKGSYADRGYRLLEDLYDEDGNPEGWAKYLRYIAAWKAGTARMSFPLEELPSEVQRRQAVQLVDNEFGGEFSPAKPTTGEDHPLPVKKTAK